MKERKKVHAKKSVIFCDQCGIFRFGQHLGRGRLIAECGHETQIDVYQESLPDGGRMIFDLRVGRKTTVYPRE